jgi:hypothetical protein
LEKKEFGEGETSQKEKEGKVTKDHRRIQSFFSKILHSDSPDDNCGVMIHVIVCGCG